MQQVYVNKTTQEQVQAVQVVQNYHKETTFTDFPSWLYNLMQDHTISFSKNTVDVWLEQSSFTLRTNDWLILDAEGNLSKESNSKFNKEYLNK